MRKPQNRIFRVLRVIFEPNGGSQLKPGQTLIFITCSKVARYNNDCHEFIIRYIMAARWRWGNPQKRTRQRYGRMNNQFFFFLKTASWLAGENDPRRKRDADLGNTRIINAHNINTRLIKQHSGILETRLRKGTKISQ